MSAEYIKILESQLAKQIEMRAQDAELKMTGSLENPAEGHKQLLREHDRLIAMYQDLIDRMRARIESYPH